MTYFSFPRRVHIIIIPPCEKCMYHHHCSSLQGRIDIINIIVHTCEEESISSISLFLLARKVFSINIIVPPCEESLFKLHQDCHGVLVTTSATCSLVLTYWSFISRFNTISHRILCHLYATLVVTKNHCGVQFHFK